MGSKDMEKLAELVDASLKFTRVLKKKGVSQATLQVAVRCRPLTPTERSLGSRPITRLVDNKIVVVMDPQPNHANHNVYGKGKSSAAQKREKKYVFDAAFDGSCDNREIYGKTVGNLVPGVLKGLNATVFAYGATGSGKTYTMVGSNMDPGLMVLSLRDIFEHIDRDTEKQIDVTCSYLEVYNEIIYDLLQPTAAQRGLDLREDPENGPQVAGLRRLKLQSAEKIFQLLREGNLRRRTESTDANAESSRSHAVLEIVVRRSDKNHYAKNVYTGKLALVDLAGAERAHETNNHGQQLRDGANINRSLLALANCINALGKRKKKGFVFVPFRNSKLTRLLKDGLCGNSRTIMIATCASADTQYNHTVNTLKYADRAKEIKTHVRMDKKTVDTHIAEYQRMIDALQDENRDLKMAVHAMTGTKWQGLQNIPKFDKLSKPAIEATSPQAKTPQPKKAAKVEKDQRSEQKAAWMRRTSESMKTLSTNRAKCQQELLEAHQRKIRHQIDAEMISEQIQAKLKSDETHDIQMLHQRKSDAAISLSDSNSSVAHLENTMSSYDAQLAILEAEIESSSASSERDALRLQAVAGRRETENVFSKIDARARNAIIMEQNSVINCLWQILERHGVNKDMATETAWNAKIFPHSGSSQDSKTFFQQYKSVNNSEQKEVLKKALTGYKNDLETKQWADLSSITASTTEKASKATARMAEAAVLVQATKNDPNPNPASRAARTNTLRSSETASNTKKLSEKLSEKSETPPPKVIQAFGSPSSKENSNPAKVKGKKKLEGKKGKDVSQIGNLKLAMRKRRQSISDR